MCGGPVVVLVSPQIRPCRDVLRILRASDQPGCSRLEGVARERIEIVVFFVRADELWRMRMVVDRADAADLGHESWINARSLTGRRADDRGKQRGGGRK